MALALIMLMGAFIKLCSMHTPTNNPNMPKHKEFPGKSDFFKKKICGEKILFHENFKNSGMAVILAHVRIPSWGGAFIRPKKPIDMILSPLAQVTGIGLSPKCTTPRKVSQNPLVIPTNKKGLKFYYF